MVRRWDIEPEEFTDLEELERPDGMYVHYSDYAKLEEALRDVVNGYDKSMIWVDDEGNPFTASIKKAREVLGDA